MARSLPSSLAPLVEELELEQPRVVTLAQLTSIAEQVGMKSDQADTRRLAYELQRRGWLGRLRTVNAWEFLPGARAGAYGSGDRLIELRAQLATKPRMPVGLAMESAAVMHRLAQRAPDQEVIGLPSGTGLPKALSRFRVVRIDLPSEVDVVIDELPVWSVDALLVGIGARPSAYRDLAGLAQWLPECGSRIDYEQLLACLLVTNSATTQRVSYLLQLAERLDLAEDLVRRYPPTVPVWFGAARSGGRQNRLSRVLDADLAPLMSGGIGA